MRETRVIVLCALVFSVWACAEPERRTLSDSAVACGADTTLTRPQAREIIIPDDEPPCELVLVPTGIVLKADTAGTRPDAGSFHARASRGRFYSGSV